MNTVTCEVFALCTNAAEGVIFNPVLEYVPACTRCANRTSQELQEAEFEIV